MVVAGDKQSFDRMRLKVRARAFGKAMNGAPATLDWSRGRDNAYVGVEQFAQRPEFAAAIDFDFGTHLRPRIGKPNGNAFRAPKGEIMDHDADAQVCNPGDERMINVPAARPL